MNKLKLVNYNLEWTLLGGQSFSWDFIDGYYYGFTNSSAIKCRLDEEYLLWQTYPEKNDEEFIKRYFRLDVDYETILSRINKDIYTANAIKQYPNLRLLSQDFEQTLLSFILSANNNIKSIRKSIRILNEMYGKRINIDGKEMYLFPRTANIAEASLDNLLKSKIGFRANYLKKAAEHLQHSNLPKRILSFSEKEARESMMEIKGVGNKISDCVLTFSLGFDNVTPIDVWVKRIVTQFYGLDPKMKYEEIRKWLDDYFEGYTSWAGQFLFEYIRNLRPQIS